MRPLFALPLLTAAVSVSAMDLHWEFTPYLDSGCKEHKDLPPLSGDKLTGCTKLQSDKVKSVRVNGPKNGDVNQPFIIFYTSDKCDDDDDNKRPREPQGNNKCQEIDETHKVTKSFTHFRVGNLALLELFFSRS